jgi:hypothetical protein
MTQQQIYVGLLDEGVPVWRPVSALEVSPGVFVILASGLARHGTSHENWEFVPGELEHFQVKWTRFTVENAARTKTRADSTQLKTALVRYETKALSGADVLVAVSRY